jgi:hypothetical protein
VGTAAALRDLTSTVQDQSTALRVLSSKMNFVAAVAKKKMRPRSSKASKGRDWNFRQNLIKFYAAACKGEEHSPPTVPGSAGTATAGAGAAARSSQSGGQQQDPDLMLCMVTGYLVPASFIVAGHLFPMRLKVRYRVAIAVATAAILLLYYQLILLLYCFSGLFQIVGHR